MRVGIYISVLATIFCVRTLDCVIPTFFERTWWKGGRKRFDEYGIVYWLLDETWKRSTLIMRHASSHFKRPGDWRLILTGQNPKRTPKSRQILWTFAQSSIKCLHTLWLLCIYCDWICPNPAQILILHEHAHDGSEHSLISSSCMSVWAHAYDCSWTRTHTHLLIRHHFKPELLRIDFTRSSKSCLVQFCGVSRWAHAHNFSIVHANLLVLHEQL
jgi:hypothetical protein